MNGLPALCFTVEIVTHKVVMLKKGESGYYPTRYETNSEAEAKQLVDELNADLGVDKAQAEAMFVGSMFGWDVPGANPALYDEDGKPINRSTNRNQGKHAKGDV